jgi:hypothetical protein
MRKEGLELPARLTRLLGDPARLRLALEHRLLNPMLAQFRPGNGVMFHIGRSGSTVLADLLRQHPGIYWDGEIYAGLYDYWQSQGLTMGVDPVPIDLARFLRTRMTRAARKIYGFEVKFFHLRLIERTLPDYLIYLQKLGFNHFMVLERKNYLRKVVSSVIAHQKLQYHQSPHEQPVLTQVELDLDCIRIDLEAKSLLAYLQDYAENFRQLETLLKNQNVLYLTYEADITTDPLLGYQRICNFLNVPYQPVEVRYGKTNPFNLTEIIANFTEVERYLKGTPFEWMLYE